jgi:L-alanine-DL-glutamate epimerase-like enolase superfamily enzyme
MKIVDLNGAVIGENPVVRIVTGLPDLIVRDGFSEVWDRPGMGVDLNVVAARAYLPEVDRDFFD